MTLFIQAEKIASRIIDGEAVLVNTSDGYINVLNSTGAIIWDFLKEAHSLDEITQMLASKTIYEQPEQIKSDVSTFLNELLNLGLITTKEG